MPVTSDYSDGVPAIAYCLTAMDGTVLAQRDADLPFYSASTIKLGVLVAAIQAVEHGGLDLAQPVAAAHTFPSGAGGGETFSFEPGERDAGMPSPGTAMPLGAVLRRMITVSSNEATNLAVQLVGLPAVNAALAACGAGSSRMERLIGDIPALRAGLSHQVTARDLTAVVRAIVTGAAAGPALTRLMTEWLAAQEYGDLGAELDAAGADAVWGSKSGWVTGIQHDVAFVAPRGAPLSAGYVLAACTRAYAEQDALPAIRSISRLAWELHGLKAPVPAPSDLSSAR
ncbi:serine hydrolase [Arthrobacter sp. NicSoilB4]|uniref:serine hydrolase n=1 Tax=Arthrobacter sp. NicSoilB4 TaxID=2830997 RepID=UPI001CC82CDD|nr:serine hydrolase [Arthrobacter sp. NicSoilB4]BCW66111.1 serine hydrolase [Arthrobacter sp. NicSoilB4]